MLHRQYLPNNEIAKPEKAIKDKISACASLMAFPVFAVRRLRERNWIYTYQTRGVKGKRLTIQRLSF